MKLLEFYLQLNLTLLKMKLNKTSLLLLLITSNLNAFTLSFSNVSNIGGADLPILDADTNLLSNTHSTVRLGYFLTNSDMDIANFSGGNATPLISDFVDFGDSPQTITQTFGFNGFTENTWTESFADGTPDPTWTGLFPYLLVTNNSDTEYGVFKFSTAIGQEDELGFGSTSLDLSSDSGTILLGRNGGSLSSPTYFNDSFQLVTTAQRVPEPTSSALFLLGAVSLISRRKR